MTSTDPPVVPQGPFFIAFAGKKQTGKGEAGLAAVALLAEAGKNAVISAFAGPLKDMCVEILGIDRALVYGSNEDKNKPTHIMWDGFSLEIRTKYSAYIGDGLFKEARTGPMTVREVLQVMGTDVFRAIYSDVWARAPFRKDWGNADVVILADCRFPNEVDETFKHGGLAVKLERDTGLQDDHPSETALDGFEFAHYYSNNGTLEELKTFVHSKLTEVGLL